MLIVNLARVESAKLAKLARIESAKVRINFFFKTVKFRFSAPNQTLSSAASTLSLFQLALSIH